jgi:hypothetical protein
VQPRHSAHTASPVLHAVGDYVFRKLSSSQRRCVPLTPPLRSSDLPPARPTRPPAPTTRHTARDAHLGAASAPTTHAPTSTSPPFLAACPVGFLSKQGVRQSPWPTARRHTLTGRQARRTHTTQVHGPWPAHAHSRAAHSPTHPRTVRAPPTDTCAHVRFLIWVATLSRLGRLLFMSWCSAV